MNFTPLNRCLFCDSENLSSYLSLGIQPPANSYTDNPNEETEKFPLRMMLCNYCGHSQLSGVVSPDILFSNYLYVSGTTKTLENHFKEFAESCTKKYKTGKVLEIGCNDGSCLKQFKERGWDTLGIDPAINLLPFSKNNGVNVLPLFWQKGVSEKLGDKKFNIIYGTNVFAHNLSPYDFLNECLNVLEENGVIIIEAPYSFNMFKIIDVGQIYHEHINYLSFSAMAKLCSRLKLRIAWTTQTEVHGGSVRFYIEKGDINSWTVVGSIMDEQHKGIKDILFYKKFGEGVLKNVHELSDCINEQKGKYKVIGYGAAAKASTIINSLSIQLPLDYIVDDNPLKVGKYMPSTDIQILPTSTIENEEQDLAIWITAHNFKKEIIERIKQKRSDRNDVIINSVPKIYVEPI
ncbi:MAG: class I SAM-dependent methyltransferase [Bacteroidota bacterium]